MGVPQNYKGHLKTWEAAGTITKWACCVSNADGTVVVGANDNDTNFVGVAIASAASGQPVALAGMGAIVPVLVGASGIDRGDELTIYGSAGRVMEVGTASGTTYYVIGIAQEESDTVGNQVAMLVNPYTKRAVNEGL
jgi:hypothetical protein